MNAKNCCRFLIVIFVLSVASCGGSRQNYSAKDAMESAERQQHCATEAIDRARASYKNAQDAVNGAADAVGRSQATVNRITVQIDGVEQKIRECRRLAESSERIFNEVEDTNRNRTEEG